MMAQFQKPLTDLIDRLKALREEHNLSTVDVARYIQSHNYLTELDVQLYSISGRIKTAEDHYLNGQNEPNIAPIMLAGYVLCMAERLEIPKHPSLTVLSQYLEIVRPNDEAHPPRYCIEDGAQNIITTMLKEIAVANLFPEPKQPQTSALSEPSTPPETEKKMLPADLRPLALRLLAEGMKFSARLTLKGLKLRRQVTIDWF